MSERRTEIMSQLSSLRSELFGATSQDIALEQAFDRLYLGYLRGEYADERAERAIGEIRSRLAQTQPAADALKPDVQSQRERVLARNYEALAERLLSQDRGAWDMRHVEIVQGAVSRLASAQSEEALKLARKLQNRMSESVWTSGLEMAETVSQLSREASDIRRSLIDSLRVADNAGGEVMAAEEQERALAQEQIAQTAVTRAQARLAQNGEYASVKAAKEYAEQAARRMHDAQQKFAGRQSEAVAKHAAEGIREAARRVLAAQTQQLIDVCKKTLAASKGSLNPSDIKAISGSIDSIISSAAENENAESLGASARAVQNAFADVAERCDAAKLGMKEIGKIVHRAQLLCDIALDVPDPHAPDEAAHDAAQAQYLDARMLYEQKRMQFEQSENYGTASEAMLKALDFAAETPTFEAYDRKAFAKTLENMQKIRQIAQSSHSGDVGIYAPKAGSEYAENVGRALRIADGAAPNAPQLPTIQSSHAKRTNQILRDVRQLACLPSIRGDMGFPTRKDAIMNAAQPLFKRVRFSQDNEEVNALLPSLYKASGIKMRENKGKSPLRKSFADLDLSGANFELVKIIENQFDPSVKGRQSDKVSGAGLDASQRRDPSQDSHSESLGVISDWMQSHRDARRYAADDASLVKTGKMDQGTIEAKLKGEAMDLPRSVQEKLSPFLGFDLSNIKIYSGPIAGMAAEAMGAHAFTLGHSVFLGKDKLNFSSAEGLGLLAHELLHTSHFNSGSSVDMKEQEAESLEARVKNAFGSSTNPALALEKDSAKKSNGEIGKRSSVDGKPKAGTVGARYAIDPDYVFDFVCDYVFDLLIEEMRMERERNGDDD